LTRLDLLVIAALVLFWYGLVPLTGTLVNVYRWRLFRRRFDSLCLAPFLDYPSYRKAGATGSATGGAHSEQAGDGGSGVFRFIGSLESLGSDGELWLHGDNLTVPVPLHDAQTYLLPMPDASAQYAQTGLPALESGGEVPGRIPWKRVASLTDGVTVFVGGRLASVNGRATFVSTKEQPLLVIVYDGPDTLLTTRIIYSGRQKKIYWNAITPYALILGAFSLAALAVTYLSRPLFRFSLVLTLASMFAPFLPLSPPGLLLTAVHRQLWRRAQLFFAYRDMALLPFKYPGVLPNGEPYGCRLTAALPGNISPLVPGEWPRKNVLWHVFGVLDDAAILPRAPRDPLAVFGALPGKGEELVRLYGRRAWIWTALSILAALLGIVVNGFFLGIILYLLRR
jgi:hypothetical protein